MTNAGNKQSSTSAEAASAGAVYDDIVWRIKRFQSNLEADEKMVVSIGGLQAKPWDLEALRSGFRGGTIRAALGHNAALFTGHGGHDRRAPISG